MTSPVNPQAGNALGELSSQEYRLIVAFRQLNEADRRALLATLRASEARPDGVPMVQFKEFLQGFTFSADELDAMEMVRDARHSPVDESEDA